MFLHAPEDTDILADIVGGGDWRVFRAALRSEACVMWVLTKDMDNGLDPA
jgi:hypothetical protein